MKPTSLPLTAIKVSERLRVDVGDIDSLADSIKRYGQIQPIVVDSTNELVAGFRRLTAHQRLGLETINVVYRDQMPEDLRRELELEENIRRKDMTWQERVRSIAFIHRLKKQNAALDCEHWGHRETGELLGMTQSNVYYALRAAELLAANDKEANECVNMADVVRLLLKRKADDAQKALVALVKPAPSALADSLLVADAGVVRAQENGDEKLQVYLNNAIYHDDCLRLWSDNEQWGTQGGSIGYIITDPPYAIDMENLDQGIGANVNIDSVKKEHNVDENLDLLSRFIPAAYHELRDPGWLVMFCDPQRWSWLCSVAEKAGFRVQRWPLVWIKTHTCSNTMALKNWTKTVEFALVASKGNANLLETQSACHFAASNDEFKDQSGHPFSKPVTLWRWVIEAIVPPGMAFIDPFAGRGSSHIAAVQSGRHCVSIERNDEHYAHLFNNVRNEYTKKYGKLVEFK